MELHAALADFDPLTGRLTMQSVSQVGYYLHLMLARCLEMDESNIRLINPLSAAVSVRASRCSISRS